MFSKAKRFEPVAPAKCVSKGLSKSEKPVKPSLPLKSLDAKSVTKINIDSHSQCSSSLKSTKSFVTPKPTKNILTKPVSSTKKILPSTKFITKTTGVKVQDDIIKAHEVEIRNKDTTINEYVKQIEELKDDLANLQKLLDKTPKGSSDLENLDCQLAAINLNGKTCQQNSCKNKLNSDAIINDLQKKITELENQCDKLEKEVSNKQVELTSLEDVITIRDSLCTDLQNKLTDMESCLVETRQRLEMVKGHHALALEANESIRREYKADLETMKSKLEDEKQAIISKHQIDQENIRSHYNSLIETVKTQMSKDKDDKIFELKQLLTVKDQEMKAKLEQMDEATHDKLRLCEIEFEERTRNLQDCWSQQQNKIKCLENEVKHLRYTLELTEETQNKLQKELQDFKGECDLLKIEKDKLNLELESTKESSKKKIIDFENEINKLTFEIDKVTKEKNKFEMSLSVTRDIVQVLTMRLRESDNELEHLENQVQTLTNTKEVLESELSTYKNSLNNTILECNEYKEALVNILNSKAALVKEHKRIMEHNASLIESLQNVEKEAYRELGTIKNELIEDVELIKNESTCQIKKLKEEVEEQRAMFSLATECATQARDSLIFATQELARLDADNCLLNQQIQDQQSLVVKLSLLRQENEELTMKVAEHTSLIEKMKKDTEQGQTKPKSPSVFRKAQKVGKENVQNIISPLRERNH